MNGLMSIMDLWIIGWSYDLQLQVIKLKKLFQHIPTPLYQ